MRAGPARPRAPRGAYLLPPPRSRVPAAVAAGGRLPAVTSPVCRAAKRGRAAALFPRGNDAADTERQSLQTPAKYLLPLRLRCQPKEEKVLGGEESQAACKSRKQTNNSCHAKENREAPPAPLGCRHSFCLFRTWCTARELPWEHERGGFSLGLPGRRKKHLLK